MLSATPKPGAWFHGIADKRAYYYANTGLLPRLRPGFVEHEHGNDPIQLANDLFQERQVGMTATLWRLSELGQQSAEQAGAGECGLRDNNWAEQLRFEVFDPMRDQRAFAHAVGAGKHHDGT